MKIALIGAGNLATQLGKALVRSGHEIIQVYSRTEVSAQALAAVLQTEWTVSLRQVTSEADLYIVALKDTVLDEVIPDLVQGRREAVFVHTAGSVPMTCWQGKARHYGVFYPMQTFSRARDVDFKAIPIFIEANNEVVKERLKYLAYSLSESVYELSSEQRRTLHLAAVFACNFSNYMYAVCEQMLDEAGLPFEVMNPLIDETAAKVHQLLPHEAQTGPAMRYDINVIGKHLALLAGHPEWQQLYELISKNIHHDQLRFKENKGIGV